MLEYFRKRNNCDPYAIWFEIHLMQHLLLGSVLDCFYDETTMSWAFPSSSEGITACLTQKYFKNNFKRKIENLKNIEVKQKIQHSFLKRKNKKESILNILKHTVCCEKFGK